MSAKHPVLARLGATPEEYAHLGMTPEIEPREDGRRTTGEPGTYEWWYFDAVLSDGSSLVIGFYTKDSTQPDGPLAPYADVVLDRPDGTHRRVRTAVFTDGFSASDQGCDVRLGPNSFTGDLHHYRIHVETDELTVDVTLDGEVPAWRPDSGHFLFEDDEKSYFAWLAAVPKGQVSAEVTLDGQTATSTGVGYHDHQWGNVSMLKVINNWYWGRGQAGPYTVISCHLTAEERYGFAELPIFMLAKDGVVIADDNAQLTFTRSDTHVDFDTKKPVGDLLTYRYEVDPAPTDDGPTSYLVSWERHETVLRDKFLEDMHGWKHLMARVVGFDGAYLRFVGQLTVDAFRGEALVESHQDGALWELMYFGKNHEADIPFPLHRTERQDWSEDVRPTSG